MVLTNHIRYLLAACITFMSSAAHTGVVDFVSGIQKSVQETLSIGKIEPYIIPLEQGRLLEEKNFRQLDIGLSREQVKYLLGKPTSSPFNNDHWNYYYYNNLNSKEIKNLTVVFKNEKVFEIVIDQKTFKKFGQTEKPQVEMTDASIIQINESSDDTSRDKVITVSLQDNDYLDEELGVCVSNTFETFEDVKTLVISDESTLEIRADSQSQTGEEFLAEGNAEAERQSDMLKADKIKYITDTKNVSASGNVGYFNKEISVYSESAEYQGMDSDITFSKAKYFRSKNSGSGLSEKIIVKNHAIFNR